MSILRTDMKQLLPAILFTMSAMTTSKILSCKKEKGEQYMNNAEIKGIDNSLRPCRLDDPCNCPGGFLIHIDNIADPHGNCSLCNSFKAMQLPAGFNLGNNPQFPVKIKIDWKYDTLICDSTRIHITRIERR